MQVLPTKALIPCHRDNHVFWRTVPSLGETQTEGPGNSWPQECSIWKSSEDWDLEISFVFRQILLIVFSYRSQYNVSPLKTESEFLYSHHAYSHLTYSQHTCGWLRYPCAQTAKTYNSLSSILFTFAQHWKSHHLLFETFLLNFPDSLFTWFIATIFGPESQSYPLKLAIYYNCSQPSSLYSLTGLLCIRITILPPPPSAL